MGAGRGRCGGAGWRPVIAGIRAVTERDRMLGLVVGVCGCVARSRSVPCDSRSIGGMLRIVMDRRATILCDVVRMRTHVVFNLTLHSFRLFASTCS